MYQPILKGKKGEFEAWSQVQANRRSSAIPLFDLVPDKGVEEDLQKFAAGLTLSIQPGDTFALDTAALRQGATESVTGLLSYSWLAAQLTNSAKPFRPVVHLDDENTIVADALAAAESMGQQVTLRIGQTDSNSLSKKNYTSLRDFCSESSMSSGNVHLLLDFASIADGDLEACQQLAVVYLQWILANGPWASVTLASGAFPAQISKLPKQTANRLPRLDANLWNYANSAAIIPGMYYGDYGVRHPELLEGPVWNGPLPNLRYATATDWIVWREAKAPSGQPNSSFYDVCASVTALPDYRGPSFSWGDQRVEQKSRRIPGPGAGTEWITYATNAHIEFVIDRLATLGAA